MTRRAWLWLTATLTCVALAATFALDPAWRARWLDRPPAEEGPAQTPFGWSARVELHAGDGVRGLREGPAQQARFDDPFGVAVAADGTAYVADAGGNNRVRRIGADGIVATLAGGHEGFADGIGAAAAFHTPSGLALDAAGNLYVADTGNHAIRRITPLGEVSTLAGTGEAGFRDGPGAQAQFNGPVGVAVDAGGRVYVADTYNDRIRVIGPDGRVHTLAGGERPGFADGRGGEARFDTPTGIAVDRRGIVWVADTRNDAIRRVAPDGAVGTLRLAPAAGTGPPLHRPLALAATRDGLLYVAEMTRGRVLQVAPDGRWHALAGADPERRFSRPAGLALDADGAPYLADATAHRLHRLVRLPEADGAASGALVADARASAMPEIAGPSPDDPLPDTGGRWPLHPQDGWHEVVGTLGEVRGDYSGESRHHLHAGLDVRGDVGAEVLAIAGGKVDSPSATWGLEALGEGLELGPLGYVHMRVGRTAQGRVLDPQRFHLLLDDAGKPERMRVRRGTRFRAGETLGTVNRMAHVHLTVGAPGYERNAAMLGFRHYADGYPPRIDAIRLLDASGQPLTETRGGRLRVPRVLGEVQIVVDAWDQVDRNLARRRLGLYALGYQILRGDGMPLPGHEAPRTTIEFDRMPADGEAVKVAYAPGSGVTVHGSAVTRFQYVVTNTVRGGRVATGGWSVGELPPGDYVVRIAARDFSGNEAVGKRELALRIE